MRRIKARALEPGGAGLLVFALGMVIGVRGCLRARKPAFPEVLRIRPAKGARL